MKQTRDLLLIKELVGTTIDSIWFSSLNPDDAMIQMNTRHIVSDVHIIAKNGQHFIIYLNPITYTYDLDVVALDRFREDRLEGSIRQHDIEHSIRGMTVTQIDIIEKSNNCYYSSENEPAWSAISGLDITFENGIMVSFFAADILDEGEWGIRFSNTGSAIFLFMNRNEHKNIALGLNDDIDRTVVFKGR